MTRLSDIFATPDPSAEPAELDAILAAEASSTPTASAASSTPRMPAPGDTLHCLTTGFMIHTSMSFNSSSAVLHRGQSFVFTAAMRDAAVDRLGNPGWPALVYDEAAQLAKWGAVMVAPGPAPDDVERWTYGDAQWAEDRARARAAAWAETDPDERTRKLAELERRFGPAALTSKTTAVYRRGEHPSERAAEAQEERYARARARGER